MIILDCRDLCSATDQEEAHVANVSSLVADFALNDLVDQRAGDFVSSPMGSFILTRDGHDHVECEVAANYVVVGSVMHLTQRRLDELQRAYPSEGQCHFHCSGVHEDALPHSLRSSVER